MATKMLIVQYVVAQELTFRDDIGAPNPAPNGPFDTNLTVQ